MKPQVIRTEKKCSKCQKVQPIAQFSRCKSSYDGHVYHCKTCTKKLRAERMKKPEIIAFDYYE